MDAMTRIEKVQDRFTMIPNNVLGKLLEIPLSGSQMRVVLAVLRKTHGFQKQFERIGTAEFRRLTLLHPRTIMKAFKKLRSWHIVEQVEPPSPSRSATWKLNVDSDGCQVDEKRPGVSRLVPSSGSRSVAPRKKRNS